MRLIDKIYNEYRTMDPIDKRNQYELLLEPIFVFVSLLLLFICFCWCYGMYCNADHMPDGIHPLVWFIKGRPVSDEYNSWIILSEAALEALLAGQTSLQEYWLGMCEITNAVDVLQWCVMISIPFALVALIIWGLYLVAKYAIGDILEFRWELKDYDTYQKFEYDRYRLILAIDYCCRDMDVDQVGIQLLNGKEKRLNQVEKIDDKVDEAKEAERKYKIYKMVYERIEYLIGKPQYSVRKFDNTVLFSTLSISSFSVVLATITLIITMNKEGWSLVTVVIALLASYSISRCILELLRKRVNTEQTIQVKSDKEFIERAQYIMKLLEDVVFFKAPVIECDIEGRIERWKKSKAEKDAEEAPLWWNEKAAAVQYIKHLAKRFFLGIGTKPKNSAEKGEQEKEKEDDTVE